MDRRTLLKSLGVLAGGAVMLPGCQFGDSRTPLVLNNIIVSLQQEDILAQLLAVILPKDETFPGALELDVPNFVWVMVDDCMKPEDQLRFMSGLDNFGRYLAKHTSTDFGEMQPNEQVALLEEILAAEAPPATAGEDLPPESYLADIQFFIGVAKSRGIQGYMQSKYIMTEVMPYALVPGKPSFCNTIDSSQRINING